MCVCSITCLLEDGGSRREAGGEEGEEHGGVALPGGAMDGRPPVGVGKEGGGGLVMQTDAGVNRVDSSNDRLIIPMAAQVEDGAKLGAETVPERC